MYFNDQPSTLMSGNVGQLYLFGRFLVDLRGHYVV